MGGLPIVQRGRRRRTVGACAVRDRRRRTVLRRARRRARAAKRAQLARCLAETRRRERRRRALDFFGGLLSMSRGMGGGSVEIGRAACRGRGEISGGAASLKKK